MELAPIAEPPPDLGETNERYGEHGLMKLGAAKYRPCHLLNRRKIARMFKRKCLTDKKKEE